jgi:hypothetical protein
MLRHTILALALALAACGSKQPPPATTPAAKPADEHSTMEMQMPPELAKFHDVLAPRWHAEKGPQRMNDTCQAIGEFKTGADAIAKAPPPSHANADAWTAGSNELVAAVIGLERQCQLVAAGEPSEGFEQAFGEIHESFHHLLEASGAMHEDHMEEGEHGMHEHGA